MQIRYSVSGFQVFTTTTQRWLCLYLCVDVEQHQVVSPRHHKVHPGVVGVHHFVFGPVENGVVHRQHGGYGQHLVRALVPGWRSRETDILGPFLSGIFLKQLV